MLNQNLNKGQGSSAVVLLVVVAAAALAGGYFWGLNEGKKQAAEQQIQQASQATPTPTPPQIDTGYQNPFEGVKVNPFK